jgi:hypothetical protein
MHVKLNLEIRHKHSYTLRLQQKFAVNSYKHGIDTKIEGHIQKI